MANYDGGENEALAAILPAVGPGEAAEFLPGFVHLRKHLHRIIDHHRLDLHHVTERRGSPHTLVCTKNRASHERRFDDYAEDLRRMDSLLNSAPDREKWGTPEGRVVRRCCRASSTNTWRDG